MAIDKLTLPSKDNAVQLKINEIIDNMITDKDFVEKKNESSWTLAIQNANLGNHTWRALAYNGNKLIALSNTGYISTSADGETWTTAIQNVDLGDNSWQSLTYGNNKFVALSVTGYISTSLDGETWITATQSAELGSNTWRALAYDGNKFVALSQSGYISTSIDGITWITAVQDTNLGNYTWKALAYDGNKFVALSQSGYISTSIDGTTWLEATKNTNLGNHSWYAIAYGNSTFIALALSRYVSTSTDGETWAMAVQDTNLGSRSWQSVTYNGSKFIALGQGGYISTLNSLTHILGIENSLNVDFTNNNIFELLNGITGLIPDARLSNNIARTSDIGNGTITLTQGGVMKGTFTLNQSGDATINFDAGGGGGGGAVDSVNGQTGTVVLTASDVGALADTTTIPSKTSDLTNDSGFITGITSSDVTTALSYTPYNSTNPSGYITSSALNGYATETWVGNQGYLTGITGSDVVTALTYTPYNGATNPNGYITSADLPTNYVTTDTAQDISGRKTFLGEKAIYFKQQATSNKLGFTLYNPSNTELAALEYRPNTINGASLLALNCPQTTGGYVGFRYWGTPAVNIVAPKVATAGNYFMATHITNGTLTVTANNTGTVDISTLLPDVPTKTSDLTNDSGFITSSALSGYATENYVDTGLSEKQNTLVSGMNIKAINYENILGSGNIEVADTTLANVLSINSSSAVATALNGKANTDLSNLSSTGNSKFQTPLVSGTNIKTVNNTSLLGSGNIDTSEIFIAEYGTTTHQEVLDAYNAGKTIICKYLASVIEHIYVLVRYEFNINGDFVFSQSLIASSSYNILNTVRLDINNNWSVSGIYLADQATVDSKVSKSDVWYDSTSSTLYIGVAQ